MADSTFQAVVTDIREEQRINGIQRWQMSLDATEFSPANPTGTLEVEARSGAKMRIDVLGVVEDAGETWHLVEKPLGVGTTVSGSVNP